MTLDEYLESRREAVFLWGENDCGKFVAGWIQACGIEWPFEWASEAEANEIADAHGGIAGAISSVLGDEIAVNQALKGDIMQAKDDSLGLCVGVKVATPTDRGLRLVRRDYYVRAWSCRR